MAKVRVKVDEQALLRVVEDARKRMEDEANAEMRRIVWDVRSEMVGRPAAEVQVVLAERLHDGMGEAFHLNDDALRQIAEAIEADDLTQ